MTTLRSLTIALCTVGLLVHLSVPARAQSPETVARSWASSLYSGHPRIGPLTRALHIPVSDIGLIADRFPQVLDRHSPDGTDEAEPGSVTGSVLGATLGMAAGIGSGLLIDSIFVDDDTSGGCMIVLEIVGVGVGAHLGNGGHGRLGWDIGASFASLLLGTLTLSVLAGDNQMSPVFVYAVLGLQIASAVVVERSSARRKDRRVARPVQRGKGPLPPLL